MYRLTLIQRKKTRNEITAVGDSSSRFHFEADAIATAPLENSMKIHSSIYVSKYIYYKKS